MRKSWAFWYMAGNEPFDKISQTFYTSFLSAASFDYGLCISNQNFEFSVFYYNANLYATILKELIKFALG